MEKIVQAGIGIPAKIESVGERVGKNGPYLMWVFIDDNGERKLGFTDAEVDMGNRTWTWLVMLGIVFNSGEPVVFDQLRGMRCILFTSGEKDRVHMVYKSPTKQPEVKEVPTESITEVPTEVAAEELFS